MSEFLGAVTAFQRAVRVHDEDVQRAELARIHEGFSEAAFDDLYDMAVLLADVLGSVPPGMDAEVAVLIGACVERGAADPASCAEPVLFRAQLALEAAAEFVRRWPVAEAGEHPEPEGGEPPSRLYRALDGVDDPATRTAVAGWWRLPLWTPAVAAVLSRKDIRKALLPRPEFLATVREIVPVSTQAAYLAEALSILDDELLVVVHRPSGQGFDFYLSGIADNFQLHTLLAERLVSPGHVDGVAPSPEAVAACLGQAPDAPVTYDAEGCFDLVAPDGSPIWNEGSPADIPVVDGTRLLVLDPPAYHRTWRGTRIFPAMAAELTLERRLSEDGVGAWLSHIAPATNPLPVGEEAVADEEPAGRHWWKRH